MNDNPSQKDLNLKSSGYWVLDSTIIDNTGGGDYTWVEAAAEDWCDGTGTWNDPFVIENVTINANNTGSALSIHNSDVYFRIRNCTLYNSGNQWGDAGLRLYNAKNGILIDNNCSFNNENGILVYWDSNNNTIEGNILNDNQIMGIYIQFSNNLTLSRNTAMNNNGSGLYFHVSKDNIIFDNNASHNSIEGIDLNSLCNDSRVFKNNCSYNGFSGINIGWSKNNTITENIANHNTHIGINLYLNSKDNKIKNNTISDNGEYGIRMYNSTFNRIVDNLIDNNTIRGIHMDAGGNNHNNTIYNNEIENHMYGVIIFSNNNNNLIYGNYFIKNGDHAYDSGFNNNWDNGSLGNYYDDYTGSGPYIISGSAGSEDYFPMFNPYDIPSVEKYTPLDQIIKVGILGDPSHISCEHTWKGAFLAAKEINEAGGVLINGSVFYIGLISQNTFEAEENLNISKGVDAVTNLISTYDPDYIIGGLRYDFISAYLEPIMDAQIPFLPTTVAINNFSQNVLDNYSRYKYYFSHVHNNSEVARQFITFHVYLTSLLTITLSRTVNKIAILHDNQGLWPSFFNWVKTNYFPMYGLEIVKEIIFDKSTTKDDFKDYMYEIDNAGAQLIMVGSYALDNLPLISEAYGESKPRSLLFSPSVFTHLNTYWNDTNQGCKYEICYQGVVNISRSSRSIPFYNKFVNDYGHAPFFAAASAYDSIYLLEFATLDSQSLSASKIVESLEKINISNPFPGITGKFAYTASHAVFHGLGLGAEGYASGMMCQWQAGGTRVVIPNGNLIYPDSNATGALQIPDWGINIHFNINAPTENTIFTELPPAFNVEFLDPIDESWYTLNSGSQKYFFGTNESINPTAWDNLPEGIVNLTFYAN
ncbi:MAG: right-handed parallel beta-helix repeat-containing protein, partial [Promethearchaeota archaeon]